jgi:hypothetical protein
MEMEKDKNGQGPVQKQVGCDFNAQSLLAYRFLEYARFRVIHRGDIARILDSGTSLTFFAKVTGLRHIKLESRPASPECCQGSRFWVEWRPFPRDSSMKREVSSPLASSLYQGPWYRGLLRKFQDPSMCCPLYSGMLRQVQRSQTWHLFPALPFPGW